MTIKRSPLELRIDKQVKALSEFSKTIKAKKRRVQKINCGLCYERVWEKDTRLLPDPRFPLSPFKACEACYKKYEEFIAIMRMSF